MEEPVEVWPDCWLAATTFADLSTQWRSGPAGVIGLDYSAIPSVLTLTRVHRKDWPDVFRDIRVMEAAALEALHKE